MKKLHILLAAALLVAFTGTAHAQSNIISGKLIANRAGVGADGRMRWARGGILTSPTADSTRISIPGAAAAADFADTTAWLDLGAYKFRSEFTSSPSVYFQINKQLTTTTDSIGFAVQYTNDIGSSGTIYGSSTVAYITTVSLATAGIAAGSDGFVGLVAALSPATTTGFASATQSSAHYRYVRLVVLNSDTSGSTGRVYYSVTPVVFGAL